MHPTEQGRLRTAEAARYVGLSASTMTKLRVTGGGPEYSKLGHIVVYDKFDLETWLAAAKRSSTSDRTGKVE